MPDITHPAIIRFCDEQIRPAADRLARAYYFALKVRDQWVASGASTTVPNDTSRLRDGADPETGTPDGRVPISGQDIHALVARLDELVADYEANNDAKLNTVLKPAVNPRD